MTRPSSFTFTRLVLLGLAAGLAALVACQNEIEFHEEESGQPSCQLLQASLDFGTVMADGSFAERTFSIRNIGGGQLSGTVREESDQISIVAGGGFYSLGPGQLRRVTVRFRPDQAGDVTGQIIVGNACRVVFFQGRAEAALACQVSPLDLDFGTVTAGGGASERTFTITNPGPGTLNGNVSALCDAFSIVSGGGGYSLGAGQVRTVTVRFQPATGGSQDCLIETGSVACGDVMATGFAENAPLCDVEPSRHDFGLVNVGQIREQDFVITNAGGGTLTGRVEESCPGFSIVSGDGDFSLGQGQTRTVRVQFAPVQAGLDSCRIDLGLPGCEGPLFLGRGDSPPACEITPATLDFGAVPPGEFRDRSFTIRNTGGGSFSGDVEELCAEFSVISGGQSFQLGTGEFHAVTVRFQPASPGPKECTISTDIGLCPAVPASGTGDSPAACELFPGALDFGPVEVGASATRTFTLRNAGGDTLSGTLLEACDDFDITAGGGAFSLTGGQERTVTVRFEPTSDGPRNCTLTFGTADCAGLALSGIGEVPSCEVSPVSLNFGPVAIGSSVDRSFTIRNGGGGTLTGSVAENCAGFSIVGGEGPFSLGAGQSIDVTVTFAPNDDVPFSCTIDLGADCPGVSASGNGVQPGNCVLTPQNLSFGLVELGSNVTRNFTIRNSGQGPISGNVGLSSCDAAFAIVGGSGAFNLNPGGQKLISVRFAPIVAGPHSCTIETGSGVCADVGAIGTGDPPPLCEITPSTVNFDTVTVQGNRERTFTIRNAGGGTLEGNVTESCPDFSIVSGGNVFSLGAGGTKTVTVRFSPNTLGVRNCTVLTGSDDCPNVNLTGFAEPEPSCALTGAPLAFGRVAVGSFDDKVFTIANNGGGRLTGGISETCPDFTVLSGGGDFDLGAGQSRIVTVRFQPLSGGDKNCLLAIDGICANVSASGEGGPAVCSLTTTALNFGNIGVNLNSDKPFTITNTGGQSLSGEVTESCAEFSILSGGGQFSLGTGASRTVTVRFSPTSAGDKSCSINLGTADCPNVSANGTGTVDPVCQVSTASLNFGLVTADGTSSADRSFTISNIGGGTLIGSVSESCPHYSIISGNGGYSIGAGLSKTITVRFTPASGTFGTLNCTISTGCAQSVAATGVGARGFNLHVRPLIVASCSPSGGCHTGENGLPVMANYATASSPTYSNLGDPPNSLILRKPSGAVLHGGGTVSGWSIGASSYNMTLNWIAQGVRP